MKKVLIKGKYVYSVNDSEFKTIKNIMAELNKASRDGNGGLESKMFAIKLSFEDQIQRRYKQPIMVIDYKF